MMKKLSIYIVVIWMLPISIHAQTQMQAEFEQFIAKFPTKEWNDLKDIQRLKLNVLQNYSKLTIAETNRNIWYEEPQFGSNNVYNHVREIYDVIDYDYSLSAPVISIEKNKYKTCYRRDVIGIYDEEYGNEKNEIFALAKIKPFDDVIILVVGYKYYHEVSYELAIDLYSFRLSTQQMCSAVEILSTQPNNVATSVLYDNYTIHSYECYQTMEDDELERNVYRLEADGFFHQIESEVGINVIRFIVSDPDGYVNVRKKPNVRSEVLYTLPNKSRLKGWAVLKTNWVEIICISNKEHGYVTEFLGEYIHSSRLRSQ